MLLVRGILRIAERCPDSLGRQVPQCHPLVFLVSDRDRHDEKLIEFAKSAFVVSSLWFILQTIVGVKRMLSLAQIGDYHVERKNTCHIWKQKPSDVI